MPIWKIVAAVVGCVVVAPALFIGATVIERRFTGTGDPATGVQPVFTLPGLMMLMGAAVGILGILSIVWLGYRIYDDRIPTWKKNVDRFGHPKR